VKLENISFAFEFVILGILFLVYINDLADIFPDNITSKHFADDAKIYTEVSSGDDFDKLQFSLDELVIWAENWQPLLI